MLIDSNILIYAINADSPKYTLSQKFLKENKENLEITHQNILESIRILTHSKFPSPMEPEQAVESVLKIAEIGRIISPNIRTIFIGLELIKKHSLGGNRIFDAYLDAAALTNDIDTIATDNVKDFQKFPIKVFNPFP
ncbi:MAG: PIN domain-containing protein [Candidatus Woykebacteria bacterium]